MKTWAVLTQKGGSGKTTIALHLAIEAERRGLKTAILDIDPQQSASKWANIRGSPTPRVIPGIVGPEISRTLADLEWQKTDLAIIDTSPRADRDAIDISRRADLIIVPVQPSILDLTAVGDTLALIRAAGRTDRARIVLNAVRASTREGEEAEAILKKLGPMVSTQIGDRVAFRRALTAGLGVSEYAPGSPAAQEVAALYEAIANSHMS